MTDIERAVEAQASVFRAYMGGRLPSAADALSPEKIRALLELEASQPKEWSVDTIKDAPEGVYMGLERCFNAVYGEFEDGDAMPLFCLSDVQSALIETTKERWILKLKKAFGPIPQPRKSND